MDKGSINSESLNMFGPGSTANDNINRVLSLTDNFATTRISDDQDLSPPPYSKLPPPRQTVGVESSTRKLSSRRRLVRRSMKPKPKQVVNKTGSTGSTQSATSGNSNSNATSDGTCSSPELKSKSRKQLVSKETLRIFLQNHEQVRPHPTLTASLSINPYKESWAKKKHYHSFVQQHNVRDVKFDAVGNILMATRSSVQLYDSNGVFQERVFANQLTEPWGLFVNKASNTVLVSDHDEDCVKEFNSRGDVIQEYGPVPAPCGVAVSSSSYVFVCSSTNASIYVFDKRSNFIKEIGGDVLSHPTHIALSGNQILVSDECRILSFNVNNEIEFVYGSNDESRHPACLCIDSRTGYTLATNYYHNGITAVRKDMSRALHIKDTSRPSLCAISPYGNLLIGEKENQGVTFKLYRLEYS